MDTINVLVVGGGGREHAIASKLIQDGANVFSCSSNPGMKEDGVEMIPGVDASNFDDLLQTIRAHAIDLVVVGPEEPLCKGVVDFLITNHVRVLGPTKATALLLEGDKDAAKEFMRANGIATADSQTFTDLDTATKYLGTCTYPIVVKASGLAAGKGVRVCQDMREAIAHSTIWLPGNSADEKLVIEEFLVGREVSAFAMIDTESETVKMFGEATDHKAEFDQGRGENTGGMGTFSPAIVSDALRGKIEIMFQNVLKGIKKLGLSYKGPLFAGLMVDEKDDFKLLEFNVRFGDPETQSMLARMESSLLDLMVANAQGKLNEAEQVQMSMKKAVTLILADPAYPRSGTHGSQIITGLDTVPEDVSVFHMGTKRVREGTVVVAGGRVLSLTATGDTNEEAQRKVYEAADEILFGGDKPKYRTDIGDFAVNKEKKVA